MTSEEIYNLSMKTIETLKNENDRLKQILKRNKSEIEALQEKINPESVFCQKFVKYCGYTWSDDFLKSRKGEKVAIRYVLSHHLKSLGCSDSLIGSILKKDRTTILYANSSESKYNKKMQHFGLLLKKFKEIENE